MGTGGPGAGVGGTGGPGPEGSGAGDFGAGKPTQAEWGGIQNKAVDYILYLGAYLTKSATGTSNWLNNHDPGERTRPETTKFDNPVAKSAGNSVDSPRQNPPAALAHEQKACLPNVTIFKSGKLGEDSTTGRPANDSPVEGKSNGLGDNKCIHDTQPPVQRATDIAPALWSGLSETVLALVRGRTASNKAAGEISERCFC